MCNWFGYYKFIHVIVVTEICLDLQHLRLGADLLFTAYCRWIAAQQLDKCCSTEQVDQGFASRRVLPMPVKVQIKDIVPRAIASRAAFDLGQVNAPVGKFIERVQE